MTSKNSEDTKAAPTLWPFKTFNGQQTEESKKLEKSRFIQTKDTFEDKLNDVGEAFL